MEQVSPQHSGHTQLPIFAFSFSPSEIQESLRPRQKPNPGSQLSYQTKGEAAAGISEGTWFPSVLQAENSTPSKS